MIFDHASRIVLYRPLGRHLATAIDYLNSTDVASLAIGRYDVAGTDVFAMVQSYQTKPADAAKWETHRRYIDVQMLLDGSERMDVADVATMSGATAYDEAKDATFYADAGDFLPLIVRPRTFAIFFPHDAHRPTVAVGELAMIRKVVVKVAV